MRMLGLRMQMVPMQHDMCSAVSEIQDVRGTEHSAGATAAEDHDEQPEA